MWFWYWNKIKREKNRSFFETLLACSYKQIISNVMEYFLLLWCGVAFFMELKTLQLLEWYWIAPFLTYIISWWSSWMFIKFDFQSSLYSFSLPLPHSLPLCVCGCQIPLLWTLNWNSRGVLEKVGLYMVVTAKDLKIVAVVVTASLLICCLFVLVICKLFS